MLLTQSDGILGGMIAWLGQDVVVRDEVVRQNDLPPSSAAPPPRSRTAAKGLVPEAAFFHDEPS